MYSLIYLCFVILTSLLFALTEIQIEGKNGWASNLPTWRITPKKSSKFLSMFTHPNRPFTGYHFYLFSFLFVLIHALFLAVSWTIAAELDVLIFFLLIVSLEDFLWFVLNPNFGIKKFKFQYIPWHPQWWGPFPTSYYFSLVIVIILILLRSSQPSF